MIALHFRCRGTNHGQHADCGKAHNESRHICDRVTRVTTASRNKCLKPLNEEAVSKHRKDDDCWKFAKQRVAQAEYGRRKDDKHGCVNHQITDALNPRE